MTTIQDDESAYLIKTSTTKALWRQIIRVRERVELINFALTLAEKAVNTDEVDAMSRAYLNLEQY